MRLSNKTTFEKVEPFQDFLHDYFVQDFTVSGTLLEMKKEKVDPKTKPFQKKMVLNLEKEFNTPDLELMQLENERLSAIEQQSIKTNSYAPA